MKNSMRSVIIGLVVLLTFLGCATSIIKDDFLLPNRMEGEEVIIFVDGQKYSKVTEKGEYEIFLGGEVAKFGSGNYLSLLLQVRNLSSANFDFIPGEVKLIGNIPGEEVYIPIKDPVKFANSEANKAFVNALILRSLASFDHNVNNAPYLRRYDDAQYSQAVTRVSSKAMRMYDKMWKRHTLIPGDVKKGIMIFNFDTKYAESGYLFEIKINGKILKFKLKLKNPRQVKKLRSRDDW